jgi:hypothetical protein
MAQGSSTSGCKHGGYYSGLGMYARDSQSLRYVLICDACGKEMQEVSTQEYAPDPVLEHDFS